MCWTFYINLIDKQSSVLNNSNKNVVWCSEQKSIFNTSNLYNKTCRMENVEI